MYNRVPVTLGSINCANMVANNKKKNVVDQIHFEVLEYVVCRICEHIVMIFF